MKRLCLLLPAVLGTLLVGVPGAGATVTTAQVLAPADGYAPSFDWLDGNGPNQIVVQGTADGPFPDAADRLDVVCVRRGEALAATTGSPGLVAEDLPLTTANGRRTFSLALDAALPALRTPCRLHAIPANSEVQVNLDAYPGPVIYPSGLRDLKELALGNPNLGTQYDVDASTVTPGHTSTAHLQTFGGCGLWDARPLSPSVGPDVAALDVFDCAGYADDVADGTAPTTSEVVLDGQSAFTGAMAAYGSGALPGVGGRPALTRTVSRDPATGLLAMTETTDLARCQTPPAGGFPLATVAACGTLVPTGVRLQRSVQMSADGRVTTMQDRWSSVDGRDHALDLLLEVDLATQRYGIGLPWSAPDPTAYGGTASLAGPPAAPASITVASDRTVPAGDLAHPTGAITFSSAPNSIEFVGGVRDGSTGAADPSRFVQLHYVRTVGAAAPLTLIHSFSMAPTAVESRALAAQAEDSYAAPTVAITSPQTGSTSRSAQLTLTGTATDNRGVAALTVAGLPVALAPDGTWRATVALKSGANTVVARAVDGAGNATEASVAVTYVRGPARCVVPKLAGLKGPGATVGPLRRAGCRLGKTLAYYVRPHRIRKGRRTVLVTTPRYTVLGTRPGRGTRLAAGARVTVVVQARRPGSGRSRPATKGPSLPTYTPALP